MEMKVWGKKFGMEVFVMPSLLVILLEWNLQRPSV